MSVTLEAAEAVRAAMARLPPPPPAAPPPASLPEHIDWPDRLDKSRLTQTLREHGVRRANVRLNTGRPMYAFNGLQYLTLPLEYRPPAGTYGKNVS